MAINFPASPSVGDTHAASGKNWEFNGTGWVLQVADPAAVTSVNGDTGDVVLAASDVGAEPEIEAGATSQYWRGDKSWQDLAAAVRAVVTDMSFKNRVINGDFGINQRVFAGGALAASVYGYDRWKAGTGGCNVTLNATTGVLTHTSGPHVQVLESPNLASKTVFVSVEDPSGSITVDVDGVTGTITSGSGRRGVSLSVPSGSTGNVTLTMTATGVTYKRVQLEVGGAATEWDQRSPAFELSQCLRYFQTTYKKGVAPGAASANGEIPIVFMGNTTAACGSFPIARMRATPSVAYYDRAGHASKVSSDATDNVSINSGGIFATDCLITADLTLASSAVRLRFHVALDAEL